jgi:hypothetical protein
MTQTRTPVATLVAAALLALLALPGLALAAGPPAQGGSPGPDASRASKAKAYGKYCKGESRRREDGQKGSDHARCLNAMARLGSGRTSSPARACRGLSRKHERGERGTEYSRCVRAGRRLRADRRRSGDYTDPFDNP